MDGSWEVGLLFFGVWFFGWLGLFGDVSEELRCVVGREVKLKEEWCQ